MVYILHIDHRQFAITMHRLVVNNRLGSILFQEQNTIVLHHLPMFHCNLNWHVDTKKLILVRYKLLTVATVFCENGCLLSNAKTVRLTSMVSINTSTGSYC